MSTFVWKSKTNIGFLPQITPQMLFTLQMEAGSQCWLACSSHPHLHLIAGIPDCWNYSGKPQCHLAFFYMSLGWGIQIPVITVCDKCSPTEPSQLPSNWISLSPTPQKKFTLEKIKMERYMNTILMG